LCWQTGEQQFIPALASASDVRHHFNKYSMNIKLLIIIVFSYAYGFLEILMSLRQRLKRNREITHSGDKGSIWILLFLIAAGYSLSFSIGSSDLGRIHHWNAFFTLGLSMIILGLIIRIISISTLRQHFTYTVTRIENHILIESGIYKRIRHPGYLGQIMIFTGTATALSNWLSIVLMFIPVFIGYSYRIFIEEKFLVGLMGQKYIDYQKRTHKLIPEVY
jgi:protein-S-isoprenylcysteine O-methyltransferase Ste14